MISDVFNEENAGLAVYLKSMFNMEETTIVMSEDVFEVCLTYGMNPYEIIHEVLEEMFDEYDSMTSTQRDVVIDELYDNHHCELNAVFKRYPS